jgi:uncharacterized membrane protein YeaQ/YmgE (transglycosylase-associated protein family)
MDITGLVIFLAIGAVAGWLAGILMKGGGFGLLGNIVVGVIGAVLGGFVFGLLGISAGGLWFAWYLGGRINRFNRYSNCWCCLAAIRYWYY